MGIGLPLLALNADRKAALTESRKRAACYGHASQNPVNSRRLL